MIGIRKGGRLAEIPDGKLVTLVGERVIDEADVFIKGPFKIKGSSLIPNGHYCEIGDAAHIARKVAERSHRTFMERLSGYHAIAEYRETNGLKTKYSR